MLLISCIEFLSQKQIDKSFDVSQRDYTNIVPTTINRVINKSLFHNTNR